LNGTATKRQDGSTKSINRALATPAKIGFWRLHVPLGVLPMPEKGASCGGAWKGSFQHRLGRAMMPKKDSPKMKKAPADKAGAAT